MWFDQSGKELSQIAQAGYREPRLSPDGRILAISSDDARNGKLFVRVHDLAREISTRLTEGASDESPVWSHDGGKIAYGAFDGKSHYIKVISADGSSPPQVLVKGNAIMRHLDWSPDGHLVFFELSNGPLLKVYSRARQTGGALGPRGRSPILARWQVDRLHRLYRRCLKVSLSSPFRVPVDASKSLVGVEHNPRGPGMAGRSST